MAPLMLNMRWTAPTRKELALYLFVIRTFYDIPLPRRGYGDRAVDSSCALCQETLPSHASRFFLPSIKDCPMSDLFVKIRRDDLTFQGMTSNLEAEMGASHPTSIMYRNTATHPQYAIGYS
ncbi:hypothetical protein TESG_08634 [Trichophyton tonsurans CBS 112818]|uniref:Uncharacterized protein n=1 Tax=Trichophyton tonsurans (strain CBS 112818) TaxID=647933 RepID=F2S9E5_TRIT1|nr:hypothetical protein TESG_08634 [Trichophyton tonsurans CBS 112818]